MAELALAAMAAFGGGGAAAGGLAATSFASSFAAATGISTAATAAAATSSTLAILQGIASAVSAAGAIGAGLAAASASEDQAVETELQAGQEQLAGVQRQTQMKRELLRVLGENDVAFAAAGIDISGGIAQDSRAEANQRAATEISIDRSDDEFRRALLRARATGLRKKAGSQATGGLLSALGTGLSFGADLAERG